MKKLSVLPNAEVTVTYKGPTRVKESTFLFSDFLVKGAKAGGVTITKKDIASIRIKPCKLVEGARSEAASSEPEEESEIETIAETSTETTEPKVKPEPKAIRKQSDDDMPGLFDDVDN